jgi:D-inositol-3-phosphate glycosyltransferase
MSSEPKKSIVIVTHYYPPHMGGIEMVAKQQAERLASLGHTVNVITSKVSDEEHSGIINGVRVSRVLAWNGLEPRGVPFPILAPSLWPALWHAIKQADVVHVHDATYLSSGVATFIARLLSKPVVLTQHVGLVQHPTSWVMAAQRIMHRTLGTFVYRRAWVIFTLNDRVERHVADRGATAEHIRSIANGVDTEIFHPVSQEKKRSLRKKLGLSPDKPIALFVGRFVPKKGFDKVMAARDNSYQLVFAGGEPNPFTDDDVVLIGSLPQDELAEFYQAADVFVLPSEGEGFPLSVQEAMATGLPIIVAHDEGYARYKLDPYLIKLLHQPNEHSIRAAIKAILDDQDLKRAMSLYSRDYAQNHFAWDGVVAELERAYNAVLGGAKS